MSAGSRGRTILATVMLVGTTGFITCVPSATRPTGRVSQALQQLMDEDRREDDLAYAAIGPSEPTDPQVRAELMRQWRARHRPRCDRVIELLREGRVASAEDYHLAGLLLNHGGEPDDHLLAHTVFLVAAMKGHEDSRWYSALALDDYLSSIGKAQFFGTGYGDSARHVDATHMTDGVRGQFCVPSLATQRELEGYARRGERDKFRANRLACRFE